MNEDDNSSDLHAWIDPEMEARIVAMVLGEASDFEREELERTIADTPELIAFQRQIEAVHGNLRDVATPPEGGVDDEWTLSVERREMLEAVFAGEMESAEITDRVEGKNVGGQPCEKWWQDPAKIAAAMVFMLGGGLIVAMTFYYPAQSEVRASATYGGGSFTPNSSEVAALNYRNETWDFVQQNDFFGKSGDRFIGSPDKNGDLDVGSQFGRTESRTSNLFFADADVDGVIGFESTDGATTALESSNDQVLADINVTSTGSVNLFGGGRHSNPDQIGHGGDAAGWSDNDSLARGGSRFDESAPRNRTLNFEKSAQVEALDGSKPRPERFSKSPSEADVKGFKDEMDIANFAEPESESLLDERELLTSVVDKSSGTVQFAAGVSAYDDTTSDIKNLSGPLTSLETKLFEKPAGGNSAPTPVSGLALVEKLEEEQSAKTDNAALFGEPGKDLGDAPAPARADKLWNEGDNLAVDFAKVDIQENLKTRDRVVRRDLFEGELEEAKAVSELGRSRQGQETTTSLAVNGGQREFSTLTAAQTPGIEMPRLAAKKSKTKQGEVLVLGDQIEVQSKIGEPDGSVTLGAGGALIVQEGGEGKVTLSKAETIKSNVMVAPSAVELKAHGNAYASAIDVSGTVRSAGVTASSGGVVVNGRKTPEEVVRWGMVSSDGAVGGEVLESDVRGESSDKSVADLTVEKELKPTSTFTDVESGEVIVPLQKKELQELNKVVTGTEGLGREELLRSSPEGGDTDFLSGGDRRFRGKASEGVANVTQRFVVADEQRKSKRADGKIFVNGAAMVDLGDTLLQPGEPRGVDRRLDDAGDPGSDKIGNRFFTRQFSGEAEALRGFATGKTAPKVPGDVTNFNNDEAFQNSRSGDSSDYLYSTLGIDHQQRLAEGKTWAGRLKEKGQVSNNNLQAAEQLGIGGYDQGRGISAGDADGIVGKESVDKFREDRYEMLGHGGRDMGGVDQNLSAASVFEVEPEAAVEGRISVQEKSDSRNKWEEKSGVAFYDGYTTAGVIDDYNSLYRSIDEFVINPNNSTTEFGDFGVDQNKKGRLQVAPPVIDRETVADGRSGNQQGLAVNGKFEPEALTQELQWLNRPALEKTELANSPGFYFGASEVAEKKVRPETKKQWFASNSNRDGVGNGLPTGFAGDHFVTADTFSENLAKLNSPQLASEVVSDDIAVTPLNQWGVAGGDYTRSEGFEFLTPLNVPKVAVPSGLDELSTTEETFSTFSLNVSDVSFKLAKAALEKGEWPEAEKIRIEEFVNAFDYGDPLPSLNDKVESRVEQCIHPFLQQRNLVRIAMRTGAAGRAANTPLNLTFLLDNSGSMERADRQKTVQLAFAELANHLKAGDKVTLISFARQPRLLADKYSGDRAGELVEVVINRTSEGGTNLEAALDLAFEKAKEQQTENAQNRIILLTDGAANLGDAEPEALAEKIESMREAGIAFDAAGIVAEGLNDEILEALTRKGDGRYYLLDGPQNAGPAFAKQIAGALRPSAKNVKVQVEFNPDRVGNYKLLGFEKHRLKKEDFRNDSVDAAEMAAEETGVAVYQIEPLPSGKGDIGSVSVRFRDLSSGQMIEHRWPIAYQSSASRPNQSTASMRIATAAAMFAAKLKGEPLGEVVELGAVASLLEGLPDSFSKMERVTELQAMISKARELEQN